MSQEANAAALSRVAHERAFVLPRAWIISGLAAAGWAVLLGTGFSLGVMLQHLLT